MGVDGFIENSFKSLKMLIISTASSFSRMIETSIRLPNLQEKTKKKVMVS